MNDDIEYGIKYTDGFIDWGWTLASATIQLDLYPSIFHSGIVSRPAQPKQDEEPA